MPIGSLKESHKIRGTGYVCMLNISTNPMSMWAVYDYYHDDYKPICKYMPMTRVPSIMWDSDLILLYEDIKDWHPDSGSVTPWISPGKEMYMLGNMVRSHIVFPPEDLIDAVMQYEDSDKTVEEGDDNAHAAETAGGKSA